MLNDELYKITENFAIDGNVISAEPYGEGHINTTYKIVTDKVNYILQRINHSLFGNVDALMKNIVSVTEFLKVKIAARGGDPDRETLTVVRTTDGKSFFFDGKEYYRMYVFIENATSYQAVKRPEDFYQTAVAFGNFSNLLAGFDADALYESIPHFHDTAKRYGDFCDAVKKDAAGRVHETEKEIKFVTDRENITSKITAKLADGTIPLKVTHNDTKLNNIMIDDKTGKAVCVIDLDTVMPGSILYDFGDSIRFGCNTAAEDEINTDKVDFDINLFRTFADGYIYSQRETITPAEAENLAFSAILMTFECGMRFLTDYLSGDTYFAIRRDKHNLDRCRTQFRLVEIMERRLDEMNRICREFFEKYTGKIF